MKYAKAKPEAVTFILRLDPGDEIVASLEQFCRTHQLACVAVTGIGSVVDPVLAHYRIDQQQYTEKQLNGIFEITGLTGNVAPYEEESLAHLHVAISDDQMHAFGGHLVRGQVSATAELFLQPLAGQFEKRLNTEIGLRVWDLR